MTQRITLSTALLASLLTACAIEDKVGPGNQGSDFSGTGSDGSGGGSGDGAGPDMQDPGMDTLPTYPTQHPRIYIDANKSRLNAALAANTTAAGRFRSTVDSFVAGSNIWEFRIWNVALMGALTGDPKYCTKAIASIDAYVASEEALIAAGTQPDVAHDSYLKVGDKIGDLALTYDWCFASVTASQKSRWLAYANTAVWNVWHPMDAKWGTHALPWSGWSTNNPGDNYYYSFLRATMMLGLATKGETPEGDTWITQFRDTKVLGQLVPMFDSELVGGGSREGTAYGVSMRDLWFLYDVWQATTGEHLKSKTTHARRSMRTFMHQVMPTLDRFVDAGDQPRDATAVMFDYQRAYLEELVQMYPNDVVAPRAKSMLENSTVPQLTRPEVLVTDFLYDNAEVTSQPLGGMNTSHYAPGIGQVYSRSGWDTAATWVNLTAGNYTESHQHQDQGELLVFKGGWLMADAGLGSRNGIIQDTGAHSLVRIDNGSTTVKQVVDTHSQLVGLHGGDGWLYASADVTAAFGANSPVNMDQREVVFLKPNVIVVYDRVKSAAGTSQVWQLAAPSAPAISGATATVAAAGHTMAVQRVIPASAASSVYNMTSTTGYLSGYRLDEKVAGGDQRYLHVLSIDGTVRSAVPTGDNAVTIGLADGSNAYVTFNRDAPGATLAWGAINETLAPGVDTLPE